jgi:predicted transcriptional regulator
MEVWQMANEFLKVDKDLFGLGLKPIELLIVAQILEYQTKKLDCFISNEYLSNAFGVSKDTINEAMKKLEQKKILRRETTNKQQGRLRLCFINEDELDNLRNRQNANSAIGKMPTDNRQNQSIKDNIKDNIIKNNKDVINQPQVADCITSANAPKGKVEVVSEVMKASTDINNNFKF